MRAKTTKIAKQTVDRLINFLGSRYFLWLVIGFFVLNSLWIALSIRYPLPYDENFHFPAIKLMANSVLPLADYPAQGINNGQALLYGSKPVFYHYLMSFPYRLITIFTEVQVYQVVFLRMINVIMAAAGLWVFSLVLRAVGIKQIFINAGLFLFTLLPIVVLTAAHISYDNMLFLLTAWYLLLSVYLNQQKEINWLTVASIIAVGCFASLVKSTFLPIFAVSVIYLSVMLWRRHGKHVFSQTLASLKKSSKHITLGVAVALTFFVGLFTATYMKNVVVYGTSQPKCPQTLSEERCLEIDTRGVITRSINAKATVEQRPTGSLKTFTRKWFGFITRFDITAANTSTGLQSASSPSILVNTIFFGIIFGVGALIYAWRSLQKNTSWYFLLTMAGVVVASVYFVNLNTYYSLGTHFANQPRYLIGALPIVIVMSVVAFNFILRKVRWLKPVALVLVLLLFTQGGGAVTTIIRSENTWYWQHPLVIRVNQQAKQTLRPLIAE